ncbi:UNVERIFIED_CONTAM: hypothetical protein HDU68_011395 [Siphonaria sp. JEL0065]|nr:hypothetical protein HDU68_011395 [Siphonaria sp. JEL0065]
MHSLTVILTLPLVVLSQKLAPTGTMPTGFYVTVPAVQPMVFDICTVCLSVPNNPTSLTAACVAEALGGRVLDECSASKANPLHIIPGSSFNLSIEYDASTSQLVAFGLQPFGSNSSKSFTTLINVNPQAQARSPFLLPIQIPPTLTSFGSGSSLVFRYYVNATSESYSLYTLRNLTLDRSTEGWVVAIAVPSPSPIATDPGSVQSQSIGMYIIATVVIGALLFTAIAWIIASRRNKKISSEEEEATTTRDITGDVAGFPKHYYPSGTENPHLHPDFDSEVNNDEEDEHAIVVFKKSIDGGYNASVSSGRSSLSSGSNGLHSILKNRQQVEDEMVKAQMYDSKLLTIQRQQQEQASGAHHHDVSGKKVVFKETVEIAVEDDGTPVVANALFGDSEEGLDEGLPHFNDGGIEKGMRDVLRKPVDVGEDGDDTVSISSSVSDVDGPCTDVSLAGVYDFDTECSPTGLHSIYVLPGSNITLKLLINPRVANMTQFALRYHWPDYVNITDAPWTDTVLDKAPFYPADLGHSLVSHTVTIPFDIANRTWKYDYGYFQLGYFTFGKTRQASDFILRVVRNVTIDTSSDYWVAPPPASPSPDPTDDTAPPPDGETGEGISQTVYVFLVTALVLASLLFIIIGFVVAKRKRAANKINNNTASQEELNYFDRQPKASMHLGDELEASDDEVVVYVKRRGGAYTPSMASGANGGTGSSIGSYPRSILKSGKQVQEETITAQMYDPDPILGRQATVKTMADDGTTSSKVITSKKVAFKSTVDLAVVDLSMPPAIGAVPSGLFDDSDSERGFEDGDLEEDEVDFVHFNDGGVEKGIREILGKAVEVEEDEESEEKAKAIKNQEEEEYDSDAGDDWRKEEF